MSSTSQILFWIVFDIQYKYEVLTAFSITVYSTLPRIHKSFCALPITHLLDKILKPHSLCYSTTSSVPNSFSFPKSEKENMYWLFLESNHFLRDKTKKLNDFSVHMFIQIWIFSIWSWLRLFKIHYNFLLLHIEAEKARYITCFANKLRRSFSPGIASTVNGSGCSSDALRR